MSKVIDDMRVIADKMQASVAHGQVVESYNSLVKTYNEVLSNGKKLAAYIVKADEEMENIKTENEKLKAKVLDIEATNDRLLTAHNDWVGKSNERVFSDLDLRAQLVSLKAENEHLRQDISRLVAENKNLREAIAERIAEEEAKNKKLQVENSELKDENERLTQKEEQSKQQSIRLAIDNIELERKCWNATTGNERLKKENNDLITILADIKTSVGPVDSIDSVNIRNRVLAEVRQKLKGHLQIVRDHKDPSMALYAVPEDSLACEGLI